MACISLSVQRGIVAQWLAPDTLQSLAGCTDDSSSFMMLVRGMARDAAVLLQQLVSHSQKVTSSSGYEPATSIFLHNMHCGYRWRVRLRFKRTPSWALPSRALRIQLWASAWAWACLLIAACFWSVPTVFNECPSQHNAGHSCLLCARTRLHVHGWSDPPVIRNINDCMLNIFC
jgi:hypothetical protein